MDLNKIFDQFINSLSSFKDYKNKPYERILEKNIKNIKKLKKSIDLFEKNKDLSEIEKLNLKYFKNKTLNYKNDEIIEKI